MSARTWYRLPWPLAVALVLLMPWRAVAALRDADQVNIELLDYLVLAVRRWDTCAPARRGRHLRPVK